MDEMGLDELDDIEDDIDEEEERLFEEYRYVCVHVFQVPLAHLHRE